MTVGTYVTAAGLQIPELQALLDLIAAEQRAEIDPNLDTSPESPQGQANGIFVSHLREAWEALGEAYDGFNPDAAEGFLLDALCALTGTTRAPATPSRFRGTRSLTVNLNATTTVPAGSLVGQAGNPGVVVITTENVTSTGAGNYAVEAESTTVGPVAMNSGTMTVILTPVVGWNTVTNNFDAELGRAEDTDDELRLRRVAELEVAAAGTVDAIRSAILAYEAEDGSKPILDAVVSENVTSAWNSDGLPPHSIEAIVFDGDPSSVEDTAIGQLVWDNKPAGIQAFGTVSTVATDALGQPKAVAFTRPTIAPVKMAVTLEYNGAATPPSIAEVQAVLAAAFLERVTLRTKFVHWIDYVTAMRENVPNTVRVPNLQIAFIGSPYPVTFTDLAIPLRYYPTLDTSNVTVTLVAGTL